jgi:Questin oxidase-like
MPAPLYTALDDALDAIAPFGIALKNGNSNHAPMVAEALCALGRSDAVMPWLDRYRPRMSPRQTAGEPVRGDAWVEALSRRERFADWAAFFAEELAEAPWPDVLDRWVGRLAPGFCAAATHGPIRVGHAARGLAEAETPARRRELADALAGWAATYRELPAHDIPAGGAMPPRLAIAEVAVLPREKRRVGNIVAGLEALADFPEFWPAIGLIDTAGDIGPLTGELTDTFARVFLAHARDIPTAIAFIHGVTSLAALGNLVPHLDETTTRRAMRFAWQAGCGLYACYAGGAALPEIVEPDATGAGELAERAIANGDEHVIKFTEACLNRNAVAPSPAYPAAITHLFGLMPRR